MVVYCVLAACVTETEPTFCLQVHVLREDDREVCGVRVERGHPSAGRVGPAVGGAAGRTRHPQRALPQLWQLLRLPPLRRLRGPHSRPPPLPPTLGLTHLYLHNTTDVSMLIGLIHGTYSNDPLEVLRLDYQ